MPLMYPSAALAAKETLTSRLEMNALIQMYYLEAGEADRVWVKGSRMFLAHLKGAVVAIEMVYKASPGRCGGGTEYVSS